MRWVGFLGAEIDVNDKTMHHRRRNIISFIVGKEIYWWWLMFLRTMKKMDWTAIPSNPSIPSIPSSPII